MFLVPFSVDGLSLAKQLLLEASITGRDAAALNEIIKALEAPIVTDKLVADIQQRAARDAKAPDTVPVSEMQDYHA